MDGARAQLWDATTGEPLGLPLRLQPQVHILAVAIRPDGKIVLVGWDIADNIARFWDAATGQPIGPPLTHHGHIYPPAFSPDGRIILTPSDDGTARLWDAATGQPIGLPLKRPGGFRTAAFSPDGKTILTGGCDGTAQLWDAATGEPLGSPMRHESEVRAVAFSPDGKTVLTGCQDKDGAALGRRHRPVDRPAGASRWDHRRGVQPRRQVHPHRQSRRHRAAVGCRPGKTRGPGPGDPEHGCDHRLRWFEPRRHGPREPPGRAELPAVRPALERDHAPADRTPSATPREPSRGVQPRQQGPLDDRARSTRAGSGTRPRVQPSGLRSRCPAGSCVMDTVSVSVPTARLCCLSAGTGRSGSAMRPRAPVAAAPPP